MGGHYGSIHVRTEDAEAVELAVVKIAAERELKFLLAPPIKGWITIFPENNGQDSSLGEKFAAELECNEIIQCLVHDDDIFAYWYYQDGLLKDRYNSCPNYFDDNNTEPRGGDVKTLNHLLVKTGTVAKLQTLLDAESYDFEMERLERFAKLLDLPNAVTAYEYLQAGERDGIKYWAKFIHVPDRSDFKAEQRVAEARIRSEMKELKKEGTLLADLWAKKPKGRFFAPSPIWGLNPATNEILFAWNSLGTTDSGRVLTPLLRLASDKWEPSPGGFEVSSHIYNMAISPSGRWLATGNASGNWTMQLWDLKSLKVRLDLSQSRAVNAVCFSADEKMLVGGSETKLTVVSLASAKKIKTIELGAHVQHIAIHPEGGVAAVVDTGGFLHIVDLEASKVKTQAWIKEKQGILPEGMLAVVGSRMTEKLLGIMKGRMSEAEVEKQRIDSARHFLPKDPLRTVTCSGDGKWLICGSRDGVCAVEWKEALVCAEMGLLPFRFFVEAEASPIHGKLIYAVVMDDVRQRVLFSGLEGKVRFLELQNGLSGDLLVAPDPVPMYKLDLSKDRSVVVCSAQQIDRDKRPPIHLQAWNYPALCRKAGIPF